MDVFLGPNSIRDLRTLLVLICLFDYLNSYVCITDGNGGNSSFGNSNTSNHKSQKSVITLTVSLYFFFSQHV